jgi:hypothetical protein
MPVQVQVDVWSFCHSDSDPRTAHRRTVAPSHRRTVAPSSVACSIKTWPANPAHSPPNSDLRSPNSDAHPLLSASRLPLGGSGFQLSVSSPHPFPKAGPQDHLQDHRPHTHRTPNSDLRSPGFSFHLSSLIPSPVPPSTVGFQSARAKSSIDPDWMAAWCSVRSRSSSRITRIAWRQASGT